jgi:hypothetical protein
MYKDTVHDTPYAKVESSGVLEYICKYLDYFGWYGLDIRSFRSGAQARNQPIDITDVTQRYGVASAANKRY